MRPDLYDHELPGDHKNDLQEGAQRLQELMKQVPDLTVDVRDVIADGDKVVVRSRMAWHRCGEPAKGRVSRLRSMENCGRKIC